MIQAWSPVYSQDSLEVETEQRDWLNLAVGIGFAEAVYIGARYQFPQLQLGLALGPVPGRLTLSSSIHIHLLGYSRWTHRKPWFLKLGYSYAEHGYTDRSRTGYYDMWGNMYLGRDFNTSRRAGFSLSTGILSKFGQAQRSDDDSSRVVVGGGGEFTIYYRILYR